ncbi:hypothetical protein ACQPZK_25465 [Micromonospora sp. CA-249363]|uniref:hypothetical protein n=1 Tax=Micromonospora sp. CA-249363 TaxID=3239963 RepID=UPI003D8D0A9A
MVSDLDRRLAATLAHRAGGDIDPTPIVEQARQNGRRLRRRRRGLLAVGAAAACVALAALVLTVPPGDDPMPPATALLLPEATLQNGLAVGADPTTVHFSADALMSSAESATWRTGRGSESVEFRGPDGSARFALARTVAALDALPQTLSSSGRPQPRTDVRVGDRPGVAWFDPSGDQKLWFVRWQPADGLWAQLDTYAATSDEATGTAGRVRFDGARRCVVPFRLESLPAGARLLECSVTFSRSEKSALGRSEKGGFAEGSLVVGDDAGRWLTVRAQPAPGQRVRSADLVAGPYRARRQGSDVLEMTVEPCFVEAFRKGWGEGYTEAEALTILGGYRPAADLDHPDTW